MTKILVSAMTLAALAGASQAQTVEFSIVERSAVPQTVANAGDAVLDFAVRARVTGSVGGRGYALGGFGFNIAAPGEADTNGTLLKGVISNSSGLYQASTAAADPGTVGIHGLARSYTYLANINGAFNGVINATQGTFTNSPTAQEIGLVTGSSLGTQLLGTPGADDDFDGNPDTWPGGSPMAGSVSDLNPTVGATYFAEGQFVDVYRFKYTVTNFAARSVTFTLQGVTAQIFTQFLYSNGAWGLDTATFTGAATINPYTFTVTPAPASAALLGLGGLVAARRRRTA